MMKAVTLAEKRPDYGSKSGEDYHRSRVKQTTHEDKYTVHIGFPRFDKGFVVHIRLIDIHGPDLT